MRRQRMLNKSPEQSSTNQLSSIARESIVKYSRPRWLCTTEEGIKIYSQVELTQTESGEIGNRDSVYKPRTTKRELFLVKLHGLKERGENLAELLEQIRFLNQQRQAFDQAELNLATGLKAGLSERCIRNFCRDNELDPQGSMTRAELRNRVLTRRNRNALQYGNGLKRVGIYIEASRT